MTRSSVRTTLITGAASGIGAALKSWLEAHGGQVIGVDRVRADELCDLGRPDERAALCDRLLSAGRRIDAIVACAGVSPPVPARTVVAVNYFGVTDLLERLLPLLHRAEQPRAVVVSSLASVHPVDAELVARCLAGDEAGACELGETLGEQSYASSKRALTQWVRRTAVRPGWADRGVLLNGIAPGVVSTPMTRDLLASEDGRRLLAQGVPRAVASHAQPGDLAPLLAFLASADNRYLVGQVPFADGGADVLLRGDEPR